MEKFIIIHCDYDEFKPETYRGMWFEHNGQEFRFFSKYPDVDYMKCMTVLTKSGIENIFKSSSVDHFFSDWNRQHESLHPSTLPQ